MNPRLIVIDGKTYHNVDEMPPAVRQKYEQAMQMFGDVNNGSTQEAPDVMKSLADQNQNGMPDILENILAGNAMMSSMKIIVDGKEFNRIEGLPPEARVKYEEAMGKLDANRNGIPDFAEGMLNTTNQTANLPTSFGVETPRRSTSLPTSPTITPDTSNGLTLVLIGLFVVLLCVAGAVGVWYFFLR